MLKLISWRDVLVMLRTIFRPFESTYHSIIEMSVVEVVSYLEGRMKT